MKENYQLIMEKEIEKFKGNEKKPVLLLQCCCAPCSSAVIERLCNYFDLKIYYYNPNIYPAEEYQKRGLQFDKLLAYPDFPDIQVIKAEYNTEDFDNAVIGLESEPEGGRRCKKCFYLRLNETAKKAKKIGADYFCTTLTVSPHKNSALINEIGLEAGKKYGVKFLCSDFKKKEGYKRSIKLSSELDLYRQNYCGCKYSMSESSALKQNSPRKTALFESLLDKIKGHRKSSVLLFGDPDEIRTRVTAVKGRCLRPLDHRAGGGCNWT